MSESNYKTTFGADPSTVTPTDMMSSYVSSRMPTGAPTGAYIWLGNLLVQFSVGAPTYQSYGPPTAPTNNFPIVFPNGCDGMIATVSVSSDTTIPISILSYDASTFQFVINGGQSGRVNWIAWGYWSGGTPS